MQDIYNNYILQREELLARIAHELELDKTRTERMESAYSAVSELLSNDEDFFKKLNVEIYAQGSKRIETTVKPINGDDFDLDTVLHIYDPYFNHTPQEIFDALVMALEKDAYYKKIMQKKSRCVRLNYKGDFHMDILPACMPNVHEKEVIKIPEKVLKNWSSGNPKGFSKWFLTIASSFEKSLLMVYADDLIKAQVETEPLPDGLYEKTPLQRAVQLMKRYRDIFFKNNTDYRVSSIVITTLAATFYQGENSIYESIDKIISRIKNSYSLSIIQGKRFKVLNPINSDEDFTDSWTDQHYKSFYEFITDFSKKWDSLKRSFEFSKDDYILLFGEGLYKNALNEQIRFFSAKTSDPLVRSSGLITSGAALTNSKGQINRDTGTKNEKHNNFGGTY